jgi:hypothetical protein
MVDWPTGRIDDSLALFSMTMQHAILIGAAIIGARVIAPYHFSAAAGADGDPFICRSNIVTRDVQCPCLGLCFLLGVLGEHLPLGILGSF